MENKLKKLIFKVILIFKVPTPSHLNAVLFSIQTLNKQSTNNGVMQINSVFPPYSPLQKRKFYGPVKFQLYK